MLFLYRPPQTWMPFAGPRSQTPQAEYNRDLQARYAATRRVAPPAPSAALPPPHASDDRIDKLRQLGDLHDRGVLTDEEFALEKAHVLEAGGAT